MNVRRLIPLAVLLASLSACSRTSGETAAGNRTPASAGADQGVTIPADSPQLSRLTVATVQTARVPAEVLEAPGKIEADPNKVSRVALPAPGRIVRVMVHLGDRVVQGAPLVAIESPDIGATVSALRQAQARLLQAKAAQMKADADLARARDLFENRAIAQKEVLAAESAAAQAKADIAQAESAASESQKKLQIFGIASESADQTVIVRAPVTGKVLDLTVVAGEYRNDTTSPLMTIADLNSVFMTADVPETQIRLVKEGTDVDVMLAAYPGEEFKAKVSRIADTVDPQTRTIRVRSIVANPGGRLRPEMFGQIHYASDFRELPVIPASAVVREEERTSVYRENGRGHFQSVPVVLGTRTGDSIAVTSGISPGDRIVTDGAMLLNRR